MQKNNAPGTSKQKKKHEYVQALPIRPTNPSRPKAQCPQTCAETLGQTAITQNPLSLPLQST